MAGLLLLGFGLRLWATHFARFTGDESHQWSVALSVARGESFPLLGLPVTGGIARHPGPLSYLLIAAAQIFGASPLWGSSGVALLHTVSGWAVFDATRTLHGPRAGLFALALFSVLPWDIVYADRIWGSALAPVLSTLGLWALLTSEARPARAVGGLVVLAVLPQLHLSAPIVWVAAGVLLLRERSLRPRAQSWAAAAAITLLCYAPYLVHEAQTDFGNTRALFSSSGGAESWSSAATAPLRMLYQWLAYTSADLDYHLAQGFWGGGHSTWSPFLTRPGWARSVAQLGWPGALATAVSLVLSTWIWGRVLLFRWTPSARSESNESNERRARNTELALWAGLGAAALLLLVSRKTFFPHYGNVLVPILLIPFARRLEQDWVRARRWGRVTLGTALIVWLGASLHGLRTHYQTRDQLNGLSHTLEMVDHTLSLDGPVELRFAHFNNSYAWHRIAEGLHRRALPAKKHAPIQVWVRNDRPRHPSPGQNVPDHHFFGPVRVDIRAQR